MNEVYILPTRHSTPADKLSIKKAKTLLKRCPICNSKAYIFKDIVDGFYFGWSVGCPRYCNNDGIHGHDENTPKEKRLSIFNLNSAEECVEKWNKRVEEVLKDDKSRTNGKSRETCNNTF